MRPARSPGALPTGSPLAVVFVTVFLDMVGFGILIPIQPFYAESFGARPAVVTLLGASFSLMQFLFAPWLGRMSDRIGRRPVMLATIALNATGYLLFAFAQSLPMLFFARMVSGLGSANLGTAQAIVADVTEPSTRARGMGVIGAAFGLGFLLGPALGGYFGQFGLAVPAFVAAGFSGTNLLLAFVRLPETRHATQVDARALGRLQALRSALGLTGVPPLLWLYLVGTLAFSQLEYSLGLFIERHFVPSDLLGDEGYMKAALLTAQYLVLVGLTGVIVQGTLIGRLTRRFGERRLVQVAQGLTTLGLFALPSMAVGGSFPFFMLLAPVLAVGTGLSHSVLPSLLTQAAGRGGHGGILGLGNSFSALGRVLGPSFAGVLFELDPRYPFWVGGALMTTCLMTALTLVRPSASDGARSSQQP